jgi:hypothetical protein
MLHLTTPIDDDELREAIKFSRRMGNYLFLPFSIVFGVCIVFMLLISLNGWQAALQSRIFLVYAGLMLVGFVFWRISRRPRALLFFAEGLILALLDLTWAVWIIYAISPAPWLESEPGVTWLKTVAGIAWAIGVFAGMGGASIKCFQLWDLLRSTDAKAIDVAIMSITKRD